MAWVYLDDQFPDHPKVVAAGDAAAWMFVCGLAYCKRYATGGRIPKGQVAKLTTSRSPAKLAKALVSVVLWEDAGADYVVHDYDDWNKPQASRTESARKAARARWGAPKDDANAHADALPGASETHSERNAEGDASTCPPPTPSVVTSPDNSRRLGGDASDDDDRIRQAVTLLARADLAKRQVAPGVEPIGDPDAWLREAITRRSERDTSRLIELVAFDPDATPEQLVEALDPPVQPEPLADAARPWPPLHVADFEDNERFQPPPPEVLAAARRAARHPLAREEPA
jgi:hypothetical protein